MKLMMALKNNERFVRQCKTKVGSGLFNAVNQTTNSLIRNGIDAVVVQVGNEVALDAEICRHKPTIVVVQALWLSPEKLKMMKQRHPKIRFAVHLHSNMPFLAIESRAIEYTCLYARHGIEILTNSRESYEAYRALIPNGKVFMGNNVYERQEIKVEKPKDEFLHVGCFGAIRPMKNQVAQVIAAMQFSREMERKLMFHINTARIEAHGKSIYQNLMQLFMQTSGDFQLSPDGWIAPDEFPHHIGRMHIHMQLSMTETFNVVTADAIMANVPIVVSSCIDWVAPECRVHSNYTSDIVKTMKLVMHSSQLLEENKERLMAYKQEAEKQWLEYCQWQ